MGVRTSVWSLWADDSRDWRIGRAKAPVFPDPVSARPITSLPEVREGRMKREREMETVFGEGMPKIA